MTLKTFPYGIKKVALYVRKSREDEEAERNDIDTLAEQLTEMIKMANNYDIQYDIFKEVVSGESIDARTEFKKILRCIEDGKDINGGSPYQAILVRDLSRLSRGGGKDQQLIVDIITDYNIYIIIKSGKIYDPNDRIDQKFLRMESFFNHEFYQEVNYLLTNGRYRAADEGYYPTGSVPYGYELKPVGKHKKLFPIEEEAKVVKHIFDLYIHSNLRERAIATTLKRKGIKTRNGKYFSPTVIRRMLQNEAYIGTLTYGKTKRRKTDGKVVTRPKEEWIVIENAFEPIIDKNTFEKVREIMNNPKKKSPIKLDFQPNELAGIVRCECGKIMIRNTSPYKYKKQDGTLVQYNRYFLVCLDCVKHGSVYIKYYDVEEKLLKVLEEKIKINPNELKKEIEHVLNQKRQQEKYLSKEEVLEKLNKEKELALEAIDKLFDQHNKGLLLDQIFERQLLLRQNDIKALDEKINQLTGEIQKELHEEKEKENIDVQGVQQNIKDIISVYNQLESRTKKNELLKSIFDEVHLHLISNKPKKFDLYVRLNYALLTS